MLHSRRAKSRNAGNVINKGLNKDYIIDIIIISSW